MRKKRAGSAPRPSLFPFLSVLLCLLGSLMFIIAALAPSSFLRASANVELNIELNTETKKTPILLECVGEKARTFDGAREFTEEANPFQSFTLATTDGTPLTVGLSEESDKAPFGDFLKTLSADSEPKYVLFIVRPSGLSIFQHLRAFIVIRNRQSASKSVTMPEAFDPEVLKSLPKEFAEKVKFDPKKKELTFRGPMSEADREALKAVCPYTEARNAVDTFYEDAKNTAPWVDYGCELIPESWNLDTELK